MFAIYVSYYVKVKLTLSAMGGEVAVKLPFTLTHSCINEAPTDSVIEEATHKMILEGKENSEEEEDDSKTETEKDKQNNNGVNKNQETTFNDNVEAKSPEEHKCVADVLVTIENKINDRPKKFEGETEIRNLKPNDEELDLIVKYTGPDTWSDEEIGDTGQDKRFLEKSNDVKVMEVTKTCKAEIQTQKGGFTENLKRAVCCIDRRRQS